MTRAAPGGALREGRMRPGSRLPARPADVEDGSGDATLAPPLALPVRRRRRMGRVLVAGLVVAGVAAWALAASPVVSVTAVDVEGASPRWVQQVRDAAAPELGASLVRVDTDGLAARVAAVPGVLRASVTRRWPHTLVVRVVEREPAVAVRVPAGVRVFDADGVDLGVRTSATGLPLVTVPAAAVRGATVAAALSVHDSLPAALRAEVVEIGATSPDGVWLRLRGGTRVLWGSPDDPAGKAAALAVMRRVAPSGHARTVDVSAPGAPAVS